MRRHRTDKPLRTPIYLTDEDRARRLAWLRDRLGATSDSEAVRRLIDYACMLLQLFDAGEVKTVFGLLRQMARRG